MDGELLLLLGAAVAMILVVILALRALWRGRHRPRTHPGHSDDVFPPVAAHRTHDLDGGDQPPPS